MHHLGEQVREGKYGYRLARESYALVNKTSSLRSFPAFFTPEQWAAREWMYEDDDHTRYSDEYCDRQRAAALENFDLNLAFFAGLSATAFDDALSDVLSAHPTVVPVTHLPTLGGVEGVYVLVLDEYRQAYVGQASDMRRRIRQHWAGTKQFDRLIWGHRDTSVLSIDVFRALDTTRVFAAPTSAPDALEITLERQVPPDFLLNRIGGGLATAERAMRLAAEAKRRRLVAAEVRGAALGPHAGIQPAGSVGVDERGPSAGSTPVANRW